MTDHRALFAVCGALGGVVAGFALANTLKGSKQEKEKQLSTHPITKQSIRKKTFSSCVCVCVDMGYGERK